MLIDRRGCVEKTDIVMDKCSFGKVRFLLIFLLGPFLLVGAEPDYAAEVKKMVPPHPEENGLRLEVMARIDHAFGSSAEEVMVWKESLVFIEVALLNISNAPITVPTTNFGQTIMKENHPVRITFRIMPPVFQRKPTAFADTRFAPVMLAPGQRALLLSISQSITDRKYADVVKEVSVYFSVARQFTDLRAWWTGSLEVYQEIAPHKTSDQEIEEFNAAAKFPHVVPDMAAKLAGLVKSADRVVIVSYQDKKKVRTELKDPLWRQPLAELLGSARYEPQLHIFAEADRQFEFYRDGKRILYLECLPFEMLRFYTEDFGGDYLVGAELGPAIMKLVAGTVTVTPKANP